MIILTPDSRYIFHGRADSLSDPAVVKEMWVENVYQIYPGDFYTGVMIDIGANIGAVSVWAAALNTGKKEELPPIHVIAVEPEPHNRKLLIKNLEENRVADYVTVDPRAVSDTYGTAYINDGHGNSQLGAEGDKVDVIPLEALFTEDMPLCDVLKVDVEGPSTTSLPVPLWKPSAESNTSRWSSTPPPTTNSVP